MTKVIGRAKPLKVTHEHCGSIIEYYPIDVEHKIINDARCGSEDYYWLTCPACKQSVYVDEPKGFRR